MLKVSVINGPNLNLLGKREPEIYGSQTLEDIKTDLTEFTAKHSICDIELEFFQSNREYEIIEKIQSLLGEKNHWMIFNPAAFTHTSVAIRDALLATQIPFIEVHLSNIFAREEFRHKSWFSDIAKGTITGLGASGYRLALEYIIESNNK
ncbi:MAG: type II 3-dehydroquinate dehydratase [Xanthomonadales bacterium]|nr:type II 3-dehydroquinate dehydratase [Xanthomonadales bacterium]